VGFLLRLIRKQQRFASGCDEAAPLPAAIGGPVAAVEVGIEPAVIAALIYPCRVTWSADRRVLCWPW
jgi:hypothetical protein